MFRRHNGDDPSGNPLVVLELDGSVVSYAYDAANQLINEQRTDASVPANSYNVTYGYDLAGTASS